jgi:hypothetical protein
MYTRCAVVGFTASLLAVGLSLPATEYQMGALENRILEKYREASPASIIQILGVPQGTSTRSGSEFLTWQSMRTSGAYYGGIGSQSSYECRGTFEFKDEKLIAVNLVGLRGGDRTQCGKLVKPLLKSVAPKQVATGAPAEAPATAGQEPLEVLTNEDVVKLTAAGLPDAAIINKIRGSACRFDLSTDALVALKKSGASDAVIEAMTETLKK